MNKTFSIYLDVVRFAAACLVYVYHSNQRLLTTEVLPASNYGHSSVIVFFVLSGFVISYITAARENTFPSYTSSRLARVYSVAVPAIVLTLVLDAVGRQLYPALYAYPFDHFVLRSLSSLFLLNEVWFVSITSFSNVPYWSICYESWYYVAFALFMFLPRRAGLLALALLALALGPKIVLLAPIWIAGVVLHRWRALERISEPLGWVLVVGTVLGIVLFHVAGVSERFAEVFKAVVGAERHAQFTFSKFFLADYLLGVLVFLNFVGVRRVSARLEPLLRPIERPVRTLAAYTFTLYLLHQPLFLFWGAVIRGNPAGYGYWWAVTAMVAVSVWAVGQLTENKRHVLKQWVEHRLQSLQRRMLAARAHASNP